MSTQAEQTSIRTSIVVEAPIERAFSVFTEDFGRIKPRVERHGLCLADGREATEPQ